MARKHLTEAQRAEIRTLYFTAGLSKPKIVTLTGYGLGQVKRAIKEPIPQKRSGRPPVMTSEQQQELVEFIIASKENRRMGFLELSTTLFNGAFGEYTIRSTLRRLGYSRSAGGYLVERRDVDNNKAPSEDVGHSEEG